MSNLKKLKDFLELSEGFDKNEIIKEFIMDAIKPLTLLSKIDLDEVVLGVDCYDYISEICSVKEFATEFYEKIITGVCNVIDSFEYDDFSVEVKNNLDNIRSKAIYSFHYDGRRQGELSGKFVAHKTTMEKYGDLYLNFSDVLGKHSEIGITLNENTELINDDPKVVEFFEKYGLESGFNPLDYYSVEDLEDLRMEEEE